MDEVTESFFDSQESQIPDEIFSCIITTLDDYNFLCEGSEILNGYKRRNRITGGWTGKLDHRPIYISSNRIGVRQLYMWALSLGFNPILGTAEDKPGKLKLEKLH